MNKQVLVDEGQAGSISTNRLSGRTSLKQRLHDAGGNDNLHRLVLVAAFAVGAAGIILLKTAETGTIVPALFAAGVLFSYAVILWLSGRIRLEPETIGDNCYYLGFLLTLVSLSVTLYMLSEATGQIDLQRDIISGFGVALSSTVVGVFLRVMLLQYRPDIVVRDRMARVELLQAGREFRAALSQSVTGVKAFSTEAVQLASETTGKINIAMEHVAEQQRQQMAGAGQAWRDELVASVSRAVAGVSDEVRAGLGQAFAPLQGEIGKVLATMETAAKRQAEAMALDAETQVQRMRATNEHVAAAVEALRNLTTEVTALSGGIGAANKRMARGFDTAGKKLEASTEAVAARLATGLAEVDAAVVRLQPTLTLNGLTEALKAPIERLDKTTHELAEMQQRLNSMNATSTTARFGDSAETAYHDGASSPQPDLAFRPLGETAVFPPLPVETARPVGAAPGEAGSATNTTITPRQEDSEGFPVTAPASLSAIDREQNQDGEHSAQSSAFLQRLFGVNRN